MIRSTFLLAAIVMGPGALFAMDKTGAQDLLASAGRQARLFEDSARPFAMDVDFTAEFDMPRQGHLRLQWEAKDRWWSKLKIGPIEEIKFQDGEKSYTLSNTGFTPKQVRDLMDLLHVAKNYDKLVVKKDQEHIESGVTVKCMETERREFKSSPRHQICTDVGTRDIMSESWEWSEDRVYRKQFSDFADFAGHRYPHRLEFLKNGRTIISANVIELRQTPLDPQLLVPPQGAIERRECPNFQPPSMVSEPVLALGGRTGLNGSSEVEITVLADGKVGGLHVLQSGGPVMDDIVIDAVKHSKYKPAMCGTEPVIAEMDIELGVGMH
ncbi:energy transducer TonB [Occallatibacter riparius]|uniref:Energy transducer TonB n=1 Tax=Occallatibacter riparius TaxID=1002689 RepID=A0A9J7BQJ0_9BACT|nr:energy transducer TonB [Occallatibacter riparius]UWZ84833.1 energy transducer TonB [Occallatibacter riparius]